MSHGGKGSGRRPGNGYINGWDAIWNSGQTPDGKLNDISGDCPAPASREHQDIARKSDEEHRAAHEVENPLGQGE